MGEGLECFLYLRFAGREIESQQLGGLLPLLKRPLCRTFEQRRMESSAKGPTLSDIRPGNPTTICLFGAEDCALGAGLVGTSLSQRTSVAM